MSSNETKQLASDLHQQVAIHRAALTEAITRCQAASDAVARAAAAYTATFTNLGEDFKRVLGEQVAALQALDDLATAMARDNPGQHSSPRQWPRFGRERNGT